MGAAGALNTGESPKGKLVRTEWLALIAEVGVEAVTMVEMEASSVATNTAEGPDGPGTAHKEGADTG